MGKFVSSGGAVIVTRVSTGEQAKHGTSLESQLDACRAKATQINLPIIGEFEDAGVSGAFLKLRGGMQSALAEIKAGRANTLICANMTRYSRDVEHQQRIKKEVAAAGGRVVFCDMDFDDTPEGDLAFNIMGGYAECERKVFRQRSTGGKLKRASSGIQPARSLSPYGYHIVTKNDVMRGDYPLSELGKYIVVEHEAKVVRWLFESYAAGAHSMPAMMKELNDAGTPTPKGGRHWRASTLHDMLRNSVYMGQAVYGKTRSITDEARLDEKHPLTGRNLISPRYNTPTPEETWTYISAPAIVDEHTWDLVQARLKANRSLRGGNPVRARMLSGRVFCPLCGAGMHVGSVMGGSAKKREYVYYVCGQQRNERADLGKKGCHTGHYQIAVAEEAVISTVLDACRSPDSVLAAIGVYRAAESVMPTSDKLADELTTIEAELKEQDVEEAATVQAQIAGIRAGASPAAYTAVFADIASRRAALEARRATLSRSINHVVTIDRSTQPDYSLQALRDVHTVLSSPDIPAATKRDILGTIIDKVVPQRNGADVRFLPDVLGADTLHCI
jgi:site-specific DNA recombinase